MDTKIYLNRVENGVVVKEEIKDLKVFLSDKERKSSSHQRSKYEIPLKDYAVSKSAFDGSINYSTLEASKIRRAEWGKQLLSRVRNQPSREKIYNSTQFKIYFSDLVDGKIEQKEVKLDEIIANYKMSNKSFLGMPRFNNLVGPSKKGSDFYYITHEAKAERGREYQRNYVYQKKSPFQQMMSLQVNSDSLKGISPKDYPQLKEVLNIQRPLDTNRIEDHLNDLFKDTQVDVAAIEEKAKIQPIALTAANLSVTTYKRLKMLSVYKDTTVEEVIDAAINQMWENTKQEF